LIRWKNSDADRLHPQEQALLALFDRMTVLEQALTAEIDKGRMTRARLDHVQKDLNRALTALTRLKRDNDILLKLVERE
jgi:hypothetical protein